MVSVLPRALSSDEFKTEPWDETTGLDYCTLCDSTDLPEMSTPGATIPPEPDPVMVEIDADELARLKSDAARVVVLEAKLEMVVRALSRFTAIVTDISNP